jgi:DNA-binding CsgD family transcriptional regulator
MTRHLTDGEIVEAYASGATAREVAELAGCSPTTVLNIVRRNGGSIRRVGIRAETGRNAWSDADKRARRIALAISAGQRHYRLSERQIVDHYVSGLSAREVALLAGCAHSSIYDVLRRHDVPTRDRRLALRLAKGTARTSGR